MISPRTLLGADTMPDKVIVQVRGQAMRMKATVLKAEAKRGSVIAQVLYRYLNAFLTQITQSVACNILHSLEQRCCRWLLMTHDRVKSNQFPLTHQFLAQMLGVRRASVTVIARRLQISEHTVKFHVSSIYAKLGATSRTDAVSRGVRRGLITL